MKLEFIQKGNSSFNYSQLLILSIIILSFTISFLLRILPSDFAWELHEFDPFFNFRATEFLVNNGLEKYFEWNDELSWYPYGRDVSSNSQVMLHIISASIFWIFRNFVDLYDFVIIFPALIGSLTCVVIFGLTRIIGGTTAGLLSSLLFSISIPVLIRGQIGWFKSEPLGLFLGLLATFLILNGIKSKNIRFALTNAILGGVILSLSLSAWGGNIFFLIPLGILFISAPIVRRDHGFLIKIIPTITISLIISSLFFERLGTFFISGLSGLSLIIPTIFMILIIIVQKRSTQEKKLRNTIFFLTILLISIPVFLYFNETLDIVHLPSHRYLNAIYPLLTTTDSLTDSVSEHQTLYISQSFLLHSVLMIFSAFGVWFLFTNRTQKFNFLELKIFILALGLFSVYIGSAFMRLEVFTSIGVIILSSIGFSVFIKSFSKKIKSTRKNIFKIGPLIILSFLLLIPLFLPESGNILHTAMNVPPTISNGGTNFILTSNDWRETLEWVKINTPSDSVIGAWWDYGYWIQTISNRASLADNSTVIDHRIEEIARIFFQSPDDAWTSLNNLETDYFIIFVAGEQLSVKTQEGQSIYLLYGGGDESKTYWFTKIANLNTYQYLESDNISGTDLFWNETFLGKLIPFEKLGYVNFQTDEISENYIPGWTGVYVNQNKFSGDNEPFKLVYSSTSSKIPINGKMIGIFVYEINKNYMPTNILN